MSTSNPNNPTIQRNKVFTCQPGPIMGRYVTVQRKVSSNEIVEISELYVMDTMDPEPYSVEHGNMALQIVTLGNIN